MDLHLQEIASSLAPGKPAVVLLDQAGWPMSNKLAVPANITLVPLPPKRPELNPTENVRQFLRDNWLSNRSFKSYDDIVDHGCDACNKPADPPWRIIPIGLRDWAHGFWSAGAGIRTAFASALGLVAVALTSCSAAAETLQVVKAGRSILYDVSEEFKPRLNLVC
jgi:hypothetical protein